MRVRTDVVLSTTAPWSGTPTAAATITAAAPAPSATATGAAAGTAADEAGAEGAEVRSARERTYPGRRAVAEDAASVSGTPQRRSAAATAAAAASLLIGAEAASLAVGWLLWRGGGGRTRSRRAKPGITRVGTAGGGRNTGTAAAATAAAWVAVASFLSLLFVDLLLASAAGAEAGPAAGRYEAPEAVMVSAAASAWVTVSTASKALPSMLLGARNASLRKEKHRNGKHSKNYRNAKQ